LKEANAYNEQLNSFMNYGTSLQLHFIHAFDKFYHLGGELVHTQDKVTVTAFNKLEQAVGGDEPCHGTRICVQVIREMQHENGGVSDQVHFAEFSGFTGETRCIKAGRKTRTIPVIRLTSVLKPSDFFDAIILNKDMMILVSGSFLLKWHLDGEEPRPWKAITIDLCVTSMLIELFCALNQVQKNPYKPVSIVDLDKGLKHHQNGCFAKFADEAPGFHPVNFEGTARISNQMYAVEAVLTSVNSTRGFFLTSTTFFDIRQRKLRNVILNNFNKDELNTLIDLLVDVVVN
jgi:hypothetical protein